MCVSGCLYEGQERANGESWGDVSDPCGVCVCREGSVHCERKRCPAVSCPYPIQRECCLACDGETPCGILCVCLNQSLIRGEGLNPSLALSLQAVCMGVRSILMAMSFSVERTRVECVRVT